MEHEDETTRRRAGRTRRPQRSVRLAVASLLAAACLAGRVPATADTLTDQPIPVDQLPVDSPDGWMVTGLNDAGQLTANSSLPDLAWLRQADGTMVFLNDAVAAAFGTNDFTYTVGINQSGDVIGTAQNPSSVGIVPWIYDHASGAITALATGSMDSGHPVGIADDGTIFGMLSDSGSFGGPVVTWTGPDHTLTPLDDLGAGWNQASAFNTHVGLGVGAARETPPGAEHAVTWNLATGAVHRLPEGTGAISHATAVNALGQILGDVDTQSVIWMSPDSAPIPLPDQISPIQHWLNDAGQLLSSAVAPDGSHQLWRIDTLTGARSLVDPDWTPGANAVLNEVGQVAFGHYGPNHAYLWDDRAGTIDLGTHPGDNGVVALNNSGMVAGGGMDPWMVAVRFGPRPPASTTAAVTSGSVVLSWTAPPWAGDAPITGYVVFRNGTQLATVDDGGSFTDPAPPTGGTVTYAVAAVNVYGQSPLGAPASVALPAGPAAPVATPAAFTG